MLNFRVLATTKKYCTLKKDYLAVCPILAAIFVGLVVLTVISANVYRALSFCGFQNYTHNCKPDP